MKRRHFLQTAALAPFASMGVRASTTAPIPMGKAENCIFIWLGGGMCQIDTFDPKALGDPKANPKKAGSAYPSIETSVPGVRVCEHLPKTARQMEHVTAVRTVFHNVINEHAIATNFVHTGRPVSGNASYPSIGSIVAHQRGAANPKVPAYMLIGYPSPSRGPGFLGAKYGNIYLSDTKAGPSGFTRPEYVTSQRVSAREKLLKPLQERAAQDSSLADYEAAQREGLRLAGPEFMRNFNLDEESSDLRNAYGSEFGQRCLLARRLIQDGVRFIEVSHNLGFVNGTGWDTHNDGQLNQHLLIKDLDDALATLIADLKAHGILDKTLIAIGTEFGRPPEFDGGGGRGHQCTTFSMILAGGGLKHCGAYGVTDDLSKKIVENPVSTPDFHATIHAALGINPSHELMDASRPVPITDGGKPIAALFG
ncbi:uncharacterized protein DUF1501 [Prosthecobacter fusiformis]|uniref:Uncharacterized protein DUF1501 n=1 Tax=Prosthecobacter fusiformis TaxID=48464 RepID=A0A4R7RJX3_9BACT|nr:DUF1501 domain-containing protein [Prosthecobacter fusiformis]TDU63206.1 uncharacterized protein DUF1501 [Prosthecobacter fusiformis]